MRREIVRSIVLMIGLFIVGSSMLVGASLTVKQQSVELQTLRKGKAVAQKVYIVEASNVKEMNAQQTALKSVVHYKYVNGNSFHSKSEVLVRFTSDTVDIEAIESTYGIKLKRKMKSGSYIFTNESGNTLEIINRILKEGSLPIKQIIPNILFNKEPL
jgi:hypothetical protein